MSKNVYSKVSGERDQLEGGVPRCAGRSDTGTKRRKSRLVRDIMELYRSGDVDVPEPKTRNFQVCFVTMVECRVQWYTSTLRISTPYFRNASMAITPLHSARVQLALILLLNLSCAVKAGCAVVVRGCSMMDEMKRFAGSIACAIIIVCEQDDGIRK